MAKKRTYITTSIPYVNGEPHIGFALEVVQADTLARIFRQNGHDTYYLAGTDENAIKNVEAAEKLNMKTQELVDQLAERFFSLRDILNLSYDQFIRTTSELHAKGAQKFWNLCLKDIYEKEYVGLYCVGCESFYRDSEFPDNICPEHDRRLEVVSEKNYFFNLTNYLPQIKTLIETDEIQIYPAFRKGELLKMLETDLGDFSISRPTERTKSWGIPVPGDESQRIYVWFDALTNYITALGFGTDQKLYKHFWDGPSTRIHVIGKSIIKFHAIYWIGMLLSACLPLPSIIYAHGFIDLEGTKMSKSLGNVVSPHELVSKYGTDALRYYLLREIPSLDDGSYSESRFRELYNADLANGLGNLVSRISALCKKHVIKKSRQTSPVTVRLRDGGFNTLSESYRFHEALALVWNEITALNKKINEDEPWRMNDTEIEPVLVGYVHDLDAIASALIPYLPQSAAAIIDHFTDKKPLSGPLFPRI